MKISLSGIIGFLIVIALLGYIIYYNFFGIGTVVDSTSSSVGGLVNQAKEKINTKDCPTSILPDRIIVVNYYLSRDYLLNKIKISPLDFINPDFGNRLNIPTSYWKDSNRIEVSRQGKVYSYLSYETPDCIKGSKEGENLNYLYCSNLSYRGILKDIGSDGTINKIKETTYLVNLVLKPEGKIIFENNETAFRGDGETDYVETGYAEKEYILYTNNSIISSECTSV